MLLRSVLSYNLPVVERITTHAHESGQQVPISMMLEQLSPLKHQNMMLSELVINLEVQTAIDLS